MVRSAVLALITYALGLVPFYFLTPVHQAVPSLLRPNPRPLPTSTVSGVLPTAFPATAPQQTATVETIQKKIGADVAPVVAPSQTAPAASAPSPTAPTGDARYAFLLLGYGGGNHDGAYLSDSLMLVVVDPGHQTLTLLSIPRDSWVPLSFGPTTTIYNKINTAYAVAKDPTAYTDRLDKYAGASGAGVFASDTVSRLLGVPVRYYLGLDFQGFREMIDAVGGVDVSVPDSFTANYPANDDPSVDASWMTVRFTKGPEHMNGERAIEFARAREVVDNADEGTDFARSRRQRIIMQAFKDRLLRPGGLIHLPQLVGIATSHVDTNYSIPDVAKLSQLALGWKDVKIYQTALTIQNYLEEGTGPDGTYVLVPNSPDHSWAQIEAFTQRLWADPPVGVGMAATSIRVENDSGVPGAGTRLSLALSRLGYQVQDPTAGALRANTALVDRTAAGDSPLVAQLDADLGRTFPVTDSPPDAGAADSIVLHLGANDADLTLATAAPEVSAPSSSVGVVRFGVWAPDAASSPSAPTDVSPAPRRRRPAMSPTTGPSPSTLPTSAAAGGQPPSTPPTSATALTGTPAPAMSGTPTSESVASAPTVSATPAPRGTPPPEATAPAAPSPASSRTAPPTVFGSPTFGRSEPTPTAARAPSTPTRTLQLTPTAARASSTPTRGPTRTLQPTPTAARALSTPTRTLQPTVQPAASKR